MRLFFYFQELKETTIEDVPRLDIATLLANFGGQLGLMAGVSAVSIVELLIFFLLFITLSLNSFYKKYFGENEKLRVLYSNSSVGDDKDVGRYEDVDPEKKEGGNVSNLEKCASFCFPRRLTMLPKASRSFLSPVRVAYKRQFDNEDSESKESINNSTECEIARETLEYENKGSMNSFENPCIVIDDVFEKPGGLSDEEGNITDVVRNTAPIPIPSTTSSSVPKCFLSPGVRVKNKTGAENEGNANYSLRDEADDIPQHFDYFDLTNTNETADIQKCASFSFPPQPSTLQRSSNTFICPGRNLYHQPACEDVDDEGNEVDSCNVDDQSTANQISNKIEFEPVGHDERLADVDNELTNVRNKCSSFSFPRNQPRLPRGSASFLSPVRVSYPRPNDRIDNERNNPEKDFENDNDSRISAQSETAEIDDENHIEENKENFCIQKCKSFSPSRPFSDAVLPRSSNSLSKTSRIA